MKTVFKVKIWRVGLSHALLYILVFKVIYPKCVCVMAISTENRLSRQILVEAHNVHSTVIPLEKAWIHHLFMPAIGKIIKWTVLSSYGRGTILGKGQYIYVTNFSKKSHGDFQFTNINERKSCGELSKITYPFRI